jgi:hypothetical protein
MIAEDENVVGNTIGNFLYFIIGNADIGNMTGERHRELQWERPRERHWECDWELHRECHWECPHNTTYNTH